MRLSTLLPLAGTAIAFVLPQPDQLPSVLKDVRQQGVEAAQHCENALDLAIEKGQGVTDFVEDARERAQNVLDWITGGGKDEFQNVDKTHHEDIVDSLGHHHHPVKTNLTIYQMISKSKYTTKLAKLVSDDEDLVKVLNGTAANYTLFAPTDKAFAKIPDHGHKPSKELIKALLLFHISDDFYPARRVLATHTIPTMYKEDRLGRVQRLAVKLGLRGLTVNYFSRVIAADILGTNGVVHGIDNILFFPPSTVPLIEATPSAFSTLALGLSKTDLTESLKKAPHIGGTFFAPSNGAFAKLGARANAFLFSKWGRKYLKALLQYHVVFNETLYADAFFTPDDLENTRGHHGGYIHLDLPTQLKDRTLSVDLGRWGPFINIRVNGYVDVSYQDVITRDGVIQVVSSVLIPPKKVGGQDGEESKWEHWDGKTELSEKDLVERLGPYVDEDAEQEIEVNTELILDASDL